jgi:outer membrane protein assembly factor BamE (lipoprotein component of BamABCDE complex)
MKHIAVILGFLLLVAGCAYQQGNRFDAHTVGQLQPGVSTEQDAIARLGAPAATSNNADGTQLLQWQYVYGTAAGAGGNAHAAILFGPDHKMIRVVELFQQ